MSSIGKLTKISLIVLISVILLVLLLFGAVEFTSKPNFCSSCHFMEPYVDAWETSTHSDVTCTDCHFPPGIKSKLKGKLTAASMVVNYFTGVYKKSKPWAEIDDASCLRSGCHEEQQLNENVIFKQDIHFNHNSHLNDLRRNKKLRCTSCHSQIVQGEHMTVTETTCFLCHFKDQPESAPINDCNWCHSVPIAENEYAPGYDHSFIVDNKIDCQSCHGKMVVGDGAVLESRCNTCHAEIGKIEKISDDEFIHKMHITDHKIECESCHLPIQHKSVARTKDIFPECQGCHSTPHQAQIDLFSGTGGKQIANHPSSMFSAGLNCQACHIYHESELGITGKTLATGKSCEKCHGQGYSRLYENWEETMKEKLNLVERSLDIVNDLLINANEPYTENNSVTILLKEARYNYQLVNTGNVVHNVAYSDELLLQSYNILNNILQLINSDTVLPSLELYNSVIPSDCQNCHYGQEGIEIKAYGVTFSHSIHIEKNHLSCSNCHSNLNRHGETIMKRSQCLDCHHSQEEADCEKCHQMQAHIYDGTIEISEAILPDIMFESDVECKDCHEDYNGVVSRAQARNCSNCHEEEYDDLVEEWQERTKTKISAVKNSLSNIDYNDINEVSRQKINLVRYGIEKIENDKSLGVHNIELITNLLNRYQNIIGGILD
ncbi:cytochrome c3 family protein [Candidatus Neomarinimicrobiota bacterium]